MSIAAGVTRIEATLVRRRIDMPQAPLSVRQSQRGSRLSRFPVIAMMSAQVLAETRVESSCVKRAVCSAAVNGLTGLLFGGGTKIQNALPPGGRRLTPAAADSTLLAV